MDWKGMEWKYDDRVIFENIHTRFEKGKIYGITGESGGGKSTLLKCVCNKLNHGGQIFYDNQPFETKGYMNQEIHLIEELTVAQTLAFYRSCCERPIADDKEYISVFALTPHQRIGNQLKTGISGGERKKLMLLCQLIRNLDVLILDEPFTGMDQENIMILLGLLFRHVNTYQNICILTLHQPVIEMQRYMTILVLKNHTLVSYYENSDEIPREWKNAEESSSTVVLSNTNRHPNYWKILLRRELLLVKHKPRDLVYRIMSVTCISIFQIIMIGFHGKSLLHVSQSSNFLDQIAYFMHLFISFVTVSLLPITSLHEFQYKNDIFDNEIDQGWYPYFFIHHI